MMQSIDDISSQARQGSVAAIIQILNTRLADDGIRSRAVLDQGVLQLLCEAQRPEQLEQQTVVEQVRQILETIGPRHISKVNINGRIIKEQQLLWLEEIKSDPQKQLLWSQLIRLRRPNPLVRLWQDRNLPRKKFAPPPSITRNGLRGDASQRWFWRGLLGGASLCLFLVLVGWGLKDWLGIELLSSDSNPTETESISAATDPSAQDAFAQAVRIAEQAAADGQTAATATEWLDLANRWQRASDLMAEVAPSDNRYSVAQERVEAYRRNSTMALRRFEQLQAQEE
ncbi:uncharacterized protein XM38_041520 [Halomicronema hongdechloris C2206]|uniref:Uncharacterized protein n=1 Tax=Halomicronema hongdechloris C2206 TaxID=1641165 RepID=A0A1Z3HS98_9CYAN|nr:hypothetical protein [Halomicronema hongdechloris]ASC73190.1 uncharacterized protein XM38_041520 [Halomicronema hongdechloris C2206]